MRGLAVTIKVCRIPATGPLREERIQRPFTLEGNGMIFLILVGLSLYTWWHAQQQRST